jgi:acid phosphatase (class A)
VPHSKLVASIAFVFATSVAAFAADAPAEPQPYLAAGDEADAAQFLPAFPVKGSHAKAEDQYVFDKLRHAKGSARWKQAIADADWHSTAVIAGYSCALGVTLDTSNAPHLIALMDRAQEDLQIASSKAKTYFHRDRPFVGNRKATCVERSTVSNGKTISYSYPSGHSALGWMSALILAELVPDRASAVIARGRAYGESRAVCGMHWESDVETGRYVGAAVVATLHSNAAFRADMDAARTEIAAARSAPPAADATCAARSASDKVRPW